MSNPQLDTIQDPSTQIVRAQFVTGVRELVRGRELQFLSEMLPIVHSQSVYLDLSSIERIDAAGLSALVSLYREACKAGYEFAIVNPSRRVARILAVVGLDRVLVRDASGDSLPLCSVRFDLCA